MPGTLGITMRISQLFRSKYLKATDLDGQDRIVTILNVTEEEIGDDRQKKPVVYFHDVPTALVLNKTNATAIAASYDDDTVAWIGKRVTSLHMI